MTTPLPEDIPDTSNKITISKMDAARRQLKTAIRLWFEEGDPVAIHTLAAAAHEIIHRKFRDKGLRGLFFDSLLIKKEMRGEWAKAIKKHANFFKHAGQKDETTIDFNVEINFVFLLVCCKALREMDENLGIEELSFTQWIIVNKPHLLVKGAYDNFPIEYIHDLREMSKREFLNLQEAAQKISHLGPKDRLNCPEA